MLISEILFFSKNSKVAFFGAMPDPLTEIGFWPLLQIKAKQSPPKPVEPGSITDCTAEAAIAASTALPPFFNIDMASSELSGWDVAAIPFDPKMFDLPGI